MQKKTEKYKENGARIARARQRILQEDFPFMWAQNLPIYERAIARHPNLEHTHKSRMFCQRLLMMERIPEITGGEYLQIMSVARGNEWEAEAQ